MRRCGAGARSCSSGGVRGCKQQPLSGPLAVPRLGVAGRSTQTRGAQQPCLPSTHTPRRAASPSLRHMHAIPRHMRPSLLHDPTQTLRPSAPVLVRVVRAAGAAALMLALAAAAAASVRMRVLVLVRVVMVMRVGVGVALVRAVGAAALVVVAVLVLVRVAVGVVVVRLLRQHLHAIAGQGRPEMGKRGDVHMGVEVVVRLLGQHLRRGGTAVQASVMRRMAAGWR